MPRPYDSLHPILDKYMRYKLLTMQQQSLASFAIWHGVPLAHVVATWRDPEFRRERMEEERSRSGPYFDEKDFNFFYDSMLLNAVRDHGDDEEQATLPPEVQ